MILFVLVLLFVLIAFLFCEMNVIFYFIQNSLCFIIWLRSLMLFQFIRSLMSFLFLKMRFVKLVTHVWSKIWNDNDGGCCGCSSNEKKHESANERTRARSGHRRTKHKQTLQFISYIIVCSSDDKDFVHDSSATWTWKTTRASERANKSSLRTWANKI